MAEKLCELKKKGGGGSSGGTQSDGLFFMGYRAGTSTTQEPLPVVFYNSDYLSPNNQGGFNVKKPFSCILSANGTQVSGKTWGFLYIYKNGSQIVFLDGDTYFRTAMNISFAKNDTIKMVAYNEKPGYSTKQQCVLAAEFSL